MTALPPALTALSRAAGIAASYRDTTGGRHDTPPETARALLAAMNLPAATEAEAAETAAALAARADARALPDWHVVTADKPARIGARHPASWTLIREDGTTLEGDAAISLPPLPVGYHMLIVDGAETLILSAPDALPLPDRCWGVTLPLYGLRTPDQGGFGDYRDLAAAVTGLGELGADFVGINPIHAGFPDDPAAFSPYAPSSRRRLNTAHVTSRGWQGATGPLIDYAHDLPAHRAALRADFAATKAAELSRFEDWLHSQGGRLDGFATHQALSARFGPYWPDWPAVYRDPTSTAVADFAASDPTERRFHHWAQWRAEEHLYAVATAARKAGMRHGLYLDLAVGTHPAGAETWEDPATFARGVSLGAPPDGFAPGGQSWGIAPFDPLALSAARFRPLIETLRAQFRFAKLLRIDHVLGFDRAFWVPDGGVLPGAYVAMPRAAMLAVLRIEAARAGAVVVGEDLGNVPDGLRAALDAQGILGCRVAMFERDPARPDDFRPASEYDENVLAAFGSHDLPTWAGWRAGRDIDWRARLGSISEAEAEAARGDRRQDVAAFDMLLGRSDGEPLALHGFLASSRARLVAVQAEDMLRLVEQANLPGTVHDHPNWRRRLPIAACGFATDPRVVQTGRAMRRPPVRNAATADRRKQP